MTAVLSFGSCEGDAAAAVRRAEDRVASLPGTSLVARSSLYETEGVDIPAEFGRLVFVNSVAIFETSLEPREFSDEMHGIETALGRRRSGIRHEPRAIDIDAIAFGGLTSDDPALTLPHPEATRRRFVMAPLAEIAPDFVLPGETRTAAEIAAALPATPAVRILLCR